MKMRNTLTDMILKAVCGSAALAAVSLWVSVETGTLENYLKTANEIASTETLATVVSLEAIENAFSSAPKSTTLTAPPSGFLDGLQSNPFLLGVIGKEDVQPEATGAQILENPVFDRDLVLTDSDSRIDDQFDIPETLKDRVSFWFDVYTKYDQNRRIVHHQRFPWIIFKVIDVSDIINSDTPRVRWLRNVKADNVVKAEQARIKTIVGKLAKGVAPAKLKDDEKFVADALLKLVDKKNSMKSVAREALSDVRVQTGQRNFFMDGLAVSPRYLNSMEKIFRAKKLPIELTRLPFVESSFNQHAVSKVGAGGIWQFLGNTGRKFLIVDGKIDERRSPFKASEAAAMLLRENHMILGKSWPLAITAWNHGPGGVRKACKAAGSKDLGTVVSKYRSKSFDFASSNFYSEFLGALYAERYNDVIFGKIDRQSELVPMVVRVQKAVRIGDVIRSSGLSRDEFLLMNPDLNEVVKANSFLPVGFRLHLPENARVSVERLVNVPGKSIARAY